MSLRITFDGDTEVWFRNYCKAKGLIMHVALRNLVAPVLEDLRLSETSGSVPVKTGKAGINPQSEPKIPEKSRPEPVEPEKVQPGKLKLITRKVWNSLDTDEKRFKAVFIDDRPIDKNDTNLRTEIIAWAEEHSEIDEDDIPPEEEDDEQAEWG